MSHEPTPLAWRTFDGEGGYDFRNYDENEHYREEYIKRNGEHYASWVEPLYDHPQAPTGQQAEVTAEQIRDVFLAHGFTVKEGQTDLKPYVYQAARALLALAGQQQAAPTDEQILRCNYLADNDHADCIIAAPDSQLVQFARAVLALAGQQHPPWCSGGCCNPLGEAPTGQQADVTDEQIDTYFDHLRSPVQIGPDAYVKLRKDEFREVARTVLALAGQQANPPKETVGGWQPIETAPRDESAIILALPVAGNLREGDRRVYEGRWDEGQCTWTSVNGFLLHSAATHWMPLPIPPKESQHG